MPRSTPALPQTRVTRHDWVTAALDALRNEGIGRVKVAVLAEALGVARSSFYWYFTDRNDLETALLDVWQARNTTPIVDHTRRPAPTITAAR